MSSAAVRSALRIWGPSSEVGAGDEDVLDGRQRGVANPHPAPRPARRRRRDSGEDPLHPPGVRPGPASLLPSASMSPAPSVSSRSPSRSSARRKRSAESKSGSQPTRLPPRGVGGRLGDQPAGDAGVVLGALAGRVDLGHDGRSASASAAPNSRAWCCGARVEVRLEDGDHAGAAERARRLERGAHLGRVVGVVVDHERALGRRADALEAPPGAGEVAQGGGGRGDVGADRAAGRQRGGGVERVVGARDARAATSTPSSTKREPPGVSSGAASKGRPEPSPRQRQQLRPVPHDRMLGGGEEGAERGLDVALRGVGRVVVELGVREHRDAAVELEQRAIGLVRLDHQPLARPPARVRAVERTSPPTGSPGPPPRRAARARACSRSSSCRACPRRRSSGAGGSARRAGRRGAARSPRRRARDSRAGSRSSRRPPRPRGRSRRRDPRPARCRPRAGAPRRRRRRSGPSRSPRPPARARPAQGRSCPRRRSPRNAGAGLPTPSPWRVRLDG